MGRIRFADMLANADPETKAFFAPEATAKAEKVAKRRIQRDGFADRKPRPSTGRPCGRPPMSDEERLQAKAKRRAYMRDLMRRKRALA